MVSFHIVVHIRYSFYFALFGITKIYAHILLIQCGRVLVHYQILQNGLVFSY